MEGEAEPLHYDSRYLWPDEKLGPWRLQLHWDLIDGRWALTGLAVRSCSVATHPGDALSAAQNAGDAGLPVEETGPGCPRELTSRELRELHLADFAKREEGGWQRLVVETGRATRPSTGPSGDANHQGPGRPPLYDEGHFSDVAHAYSEAYRNQPRNPTMKVAKDFRVSRSTAAKWVARARELGFLERTKKRVAGGIPSAPIHIVKLTSAAGPPYVHFSRADERRYTIWISCPSDTTLARLTSRMANDPDTLARVRQYGAARILVDYFGHRLSPAEDALLLLFSAQRTGPEFWHAVDQAGLKAEDEESAAGWP